MQNLKEKQEKILIQRENQELFIKKEQKNNFMLEFKSIFAKNQLKSNTKNAS